MSKGLHRDAYVLGQGFWLFSHISEALREKKFYHEMKPIDYVTIFKQNFFI